ARVAEQRLRRHRSLAGPARNKTSARGARIVRLRRHQFATSYVEGFATAAAALLVRILEHEAGLQLLLDVIHLGAEDEHRGLGVDQDRDAILLHHLVHRTLLVSELERIAEARAALGLDADANAGGRLAALVEQRLHALDRRGG